MTNDQAPMTNGHARVRCLHWSLGLGHWSFLYALLLAVPCSAQSLSPRLTSIFPCGAKAAAPGQTTEITIECEGADRNELGNPARLYFSHPSVRGEFIPFEKEKEKERPRFKVFVPSDVPPGWYDCRFVGQFGISNPRTFVVGEGDESDETEPNDDSKSANDIAINQTVNGRMEGAEDIDWYRFAATKGQRLLIECLATKADSRLDGFLKLYDSSGREVAMSQDDTSRNEKADPLIDFVVPADGEYRLKLVDFIYLGGADYVYRLTVSTRPHIDFILPTGGKPNDTTTFTVFGRNLPGSEPVSEQLHGKSLEKLVVPFAISGNDADGPRAADPIRAPMSRLSFRELRVGTPGNMSNSRLLIASPFDNVIEAEPNNTRESAQKIALPCAVNGQCNPAGDTDVYQFTGQKDKIYVFEVYGQRLGSTVDPELEIVHKNDNVITNMTDDGENIGHVRFDSHTRDVRLEWTCGEDGEYWLRVDHLYGSGQGGPQMVYRLEAGERREEFRAVSIAQAENRLEAFVVERGGRVRIDVLAWRLGKHNTPITVEARNLPPGVTSEPILLGPEVKWGTLVLTAANDAPIGEGEIQIVARGKENSQDVEKVVLPATMVYDTGNTAAANRLARSTMMAVRDGGPFLLTAKNTQFTVKQGDKLEVPMEISRKVPFDREVQLTAAGYALPQNMNVPLTKIAAGQTTATVPIETGGIPPGEYTFVISGEAQVPFVPEVDKPEQKRDQRMVYPGNVIRLTVNKRD